MLLSLPIKNGETATKLNQMKAIYLKEASAEKMRPNPHKGYIQRLQRMADKEKPLTFGVFKDTGTIYSRRDYEKDNGNFCGHQLLDDTATIIVYIGCTIIECNKNSEWSVQIGQDVHKSKDVEEVEKKLYEFYLSEVS